MPEEVKSKRLLAAIFVPDNNVSQSTVWSLDPGLTQVDKMEVPKDYHSLVRYCRFFYEHDGIAYTTINKQIEIAMTNLCLNNGTCTSENEFLIYEYLLEELSAFMKRVALEYLISGLVIPEVTWDRISGTTIKPSLRKNYELPVDLWHRDPLSIKIHKTPLPNRLLVLAKISDEDKYFIENQGKYMDGSQDYETYKLLIEQYPDFVRKVKAGETEFKLENPTVIRRYSRSGSVWPTPFLTPAIELFMHKRNLRKMDYAIASRVIQAIMLFRMGSDEFPLTEDDTDIVDNLKQQMRWRGLTGNVERVFQLFANHTLQVDWVTPDVKALLDEGKYRSINEDILISLGLPRIIVSGETTRSGSSNAEIAMLPPISSLNHIREDLLEIVRKIFNEVRERNSFRGVPIPYYPPIMLQSPQEIANMGRQYYDTGVISRTTFGEMGGFDFAEEVDKIEKEHEIMEERGIPERPEVPYSPSPSENTPNENRRIE